MANQLNYGTQILSFRKQRMFRLTPEQQAALEAGEKLNQFGANTKQNVEIWVYNPDSSYAGHITLRAEDPDIELVSASHTDGQQYEYIILNLENIAERMHLRPGRYSVSISVYQDEVSSEESDNKLIVREISASRTEVRMSPDDRTEEMANEIFEFVVPSVPRIYAKALLDQIFAKSVGGLEEGEYIDTGTDITWELIPISQNLNDSAAGTTERIKRALASNSYRATTREILNRTYEYALEAMLQDYQDTNVQSIEFRKYVSDALNRTLREMESSLELDPRFDFV